MLERYRNIIFAVVVITIVSGVVALLTYRPAPVVITIVPPGPTATPLPPTPTATLGPVKVYVTGAVVSAAAVYSLAPGSRIEDAIKAAGGARSDADLTRVNLAETVKDGQQISIPVFSANATANPTEAKVKATATATESGPVRINTADATELERLPGVGPALAQDIITYRTKNGPFKSMADLDKVSGIGPAKLAEWAGLIDFS